MEDARKPWEQLAEEGEQAFEAFEIFLRLGTRRTVKAAWQLAKGLEAQIAAKVAKECGVAGLIGGAPESVVEGKKASSRWYAWAIKFRWAERARDFDREEFKSHCHEQLTEFGYLSSELMQLLFQAWRDHPPANFREALEGYSVLKELFPPEVTVALLGRRTAAIWNGPSDQSQGPDPAPPDSNDSTTGHPGGEEGPIGGQVP